MWKLAIEGFFTAAILLIITFGLNFLLFAETRKVVLQNSTADNLPYMEEKLKKEKFGLQLVAAMWGVFIFSICCNLPDGSRFYSFTAMEK